MIKDPILVIDEAPTAQSVAPALTTLGYLVLSVRNGTEGMRELDAARPFLVVINSEMPDSEKWVDSIRLRDNTLPILMTTTESLEKTLSRFKGRAQEFLTLPVHPLVLETTMDRIKTLIHLRRRVRSLSEGMTIREEENNRLTIETERFLAVRQIVEKMSEFIVQVANEAQGGVRYFNELPYFVSIHDRNGTVLAANPTYHRYLGNRLYKESSGIYVGRRATKNNSPVGRTLTSESVRTTRALVRYVSGTQVPVTVHTAPIYDNDGNVDMVIEIFTGTEEIERLAEESRATHQRYEQLFNAVPSSIAVLDRSFRISAVNRRFRENYGDHTGGIFFDLFHPGFPAYRDPITKTVTTGEPYQGEMVLTNRKGGRTNVIALTSPIKTTSGELHQVLAIFADVTRLRELRSNLANLGLMVSTLSHDLKGSLTGLYAGLYMIDSGFYRNAPGRIEEGLDMARQMTGRMNKLVSNILYHAREREIHPTAVDLLNFAWDVAANVEMKVRGADISFNPRFPETSVEINMDAELMRTALYNLMENAIDACIENEESADHRIDFLVETEGEKVRFVVQDTGEGMHLTDSNAIFDLFYSTKGHHGTGIGLNVTRKIVEKHGGTISVKSEPGKGTRFDILLPISMVIM